MKFIADFHIHSHFSRATSKEMDLFNLEKWAEIKGIKVLGTGDFTHPGWFKELKENLEMAEGGLFKLKGKKSSVRFLLTCEVSNIYFKNDKLRKIHNLIFAPSFEIVQKINKALSFFGNLEADGRPILKLDSEKLIEIVLEISKDCLLIPCHIWTPWFSLFGSRSGFDSVKECFGKYENFIYGGETGLSSDPKMNWRLSSLDKITLISNSDAHSPSKIGREANVFDCHLNYFSIVKTIKEKDQKKLLSTIEFFPEEGKYHYDGHRDCKVKFSPQETRKYNGLCPVCGRGLTIGVLSRVEELADRKEGFIPKNSIPYQSLIPLEEIISESLNFNKGSKEAKKIYFEMIDRFGSEYRILTEISLKEIFKFSSRIGEAIKRLREGKVFIEPGYDGVYGKIRIFSKKETSSFFGQKTLF